MYTMSQELTFLGDGLRASQVDVNGIAKWSHLLSSPQQYFRIVGTKLDGTNRNEENGKERERKKWGEM